MSFSEAIDLFSLGLILAELALSAPPDSVDADQDDKSGQNPISLLSIAAPNRESFIYALCQLIGPMPASLSNGKFWKTEYQDARTAKEVFGDIIPIEDRLKHVGHSPDFVAFIMRLLALDPRERMTAQEALYHPWILSPIVNPFNVYQPIPDVYFQPLNSLISPDTDPYDSNPPSSDDKTLIKVDNATHSLPNTGDFKYRRKHSHSDSPISNFRYKMPKTEDVDEDDDVLLI